MLNPLTLAILGGSVAGGYLGYRAVRNDETMDTSDRAGSVTMSAALGGVAGAGASYIGFKNLAKGAAFAGSFGAKAAYGTGKMMTANPIRTAMRGLGRKSFGIPSVMKGPLGLLALTAISIGAVAAGSRNRVGVETEDQAQRDNFGRGSSVKERAGMLGATGDMVFGLNNQRHG